MNYKKLHPQKVSHIIASKKSQIIIYHKCMRSKNYRKKRHQENWVKSVLVRAGILFCETIIASLSSSAITIEMNWKLIIGIAALAVIESIFVTLRKACK